MSEEVDRKLVLKNVRVRAPLKRDGSWIQRPKEQQEVPEVKSIPAPGRSNSYVLRTAKRFEISTNQPNDEWKADPPEESREATTQDAKPRSSTLQQPDKHANTLAGEESPKIQMKQKIHAASSVKVAANKADKILDEEQGKTSEADMSNRVQDEANAFNDTKVETNFKEASDVSGTVVSLDKIKAQALSPVKSQEKVSAEPKLSSATSLKVVKSEVTLQTPTVGSDQYLQQKTDEEIVVASSPTLKDPLPDSTKIAIQNVPLQEPKANLEVSLDTTDVDNATTQVKASSEPKLPSATSVKEVEEVTLQKVGSDHFPQQKSKEEIVVGASPTLKESVPDSTEVANQNIPLQKPNAHLTTQEKASPEPKLQSATSLKEPEVEVKDPVGSEQCPQQRTGEETVVGASPTLKESVADSTEVANQNVPLQESKSNMEVSLDTTVVDNATTQEKASSEPKLPSATSLKEPEVEVEDPVGSEQSPPQKTKEEIVVGASSTLKESVPDSTEVANQNVPLQEPNAHLTTQGKASPEPKMPSATSLKEPEVEVEDSVGSEQSPLQKTKEEIVVAASPTLKESVADSTEVANQNVPLQESKSNMEVSLDTTIVDNATTQEKASSEPKLPSASSLKEPEVEVEDPVGSEQSPPQKTKEETVVGASPTLKESVPDSTEVANQNVPLQEPNPILEFSLNTTISDNATAQEKASSEAKLPSATNLKELKTEVTLQTAPQGSNQCSQQKTKEEIVVGASSTLKESVTDTTEVANQNVPLQEPKAYLTTQEKASPEPKLPSATSLKEPEVANQNVLLQEPKAKLDVSFDATIVDKATTQVKASPELKLPPATNSEQPLPDEVKHQPDKKTIGERSPERAGKQNSSQSVNKYWDGKSTCSYCDKAIDGNIKLILSEPSVTCHPECLKCGVCAKVLAEELMSMYLHNEVILCNACFKKTLK